jgi:hypothetical protein
MMHGGRSGATGNTMRGGRSGATGNTMHGGRSGATGNTMHGGRSATGNTDSWLGNNGTMGGLMCFVSLCRVVVTDLWLDGCA